MCEAWCLMGTSAAIFILRGPATSAYTSVISTIRVNHIVCANLICVEVFWNHKARRELELMLVESLANCSQRLISHVLQVQCAATVYSDGDHRCRPEGSVFIKLQPKPP